MRINSKKTIKKLIGRPWVFRLGAILLWLFVWQLTSDILLRNSVNNILIASPYQVSLAFSSLFSGKTVLPNVTGNMILTIYEVLVAFGIAASSGMTIGILIGQFKTIEESVEPLIVALLAVPNFVLFPIMFLLFSIGPRSDIAFGAYLGFFPVVANTVAGFRQVDPQLITLGRSLGASRRQIFSKIVFPHSIRPIVSGLKQGFSLSTIGVIGGEILAPVSGIGFLITDAAGFFLTSQLYALIIITVLIAILGNSVLSAIERRFSKHL